MEAMVMSSAALVGQAQHDPEMAVGRRPHTDRVNASLKMGAGL